MPENTLQIIIAIIVTYIAYQQYIVNSNKFRLDLYNKRFEIYNKIIELYLNMSNTAYINNETSEEDKKAFNEFKALKQSFTKYLRESIFLFEESSGIHSALKDILEELNFRIFHKESCESYYENLNLESKNNHNYRLAKSSELIEKYLLELEKSMKPYLDFKKMGIRTEYFL